MTFDVTALFKALALGYLTGAAGLLLASAALLLLRPRLPAPHRASFIFEVVSGAFLLNGLLVLVYWQGVQHGVIRMTTAYFHHLMHGGWAAAILWAGLLLCAFSLLLALTHWLSARAHLRGELGGRQQVGGIAARFTERVATIGVVGAWQPELWINPQFWDSLSAAERELALAHERLHLQRRDTVRLQLLRAISALYRVVPLARRWPQWYEDDAELAVDNACRLRFDERAYSALIGRAVEFALQRRTARLGAPASYLSERALRERLEQLADPPSADGSFLFWAATLGVLLLCTLPAAALLMHPVLRCLVACFLGY